jgi:hypothetical protein
MGDFYGDPFWGFLGRVAKTGLSLATGLGGPRVAKAAAMPGGAIVKRGAGAIMTAGAAAGRMIVKHPVLSAAGAAGALGVLGGAAAESFLGGGGACPRGFHISKSKHAKHFGQCVRNRKMNPCNPRALRRAIRRATRFTRLAMHTIHLVHPKKKGRFGGFKKRTTKR